jgi:hypothetical protein
MPMGLPMSSHTDGDGVIGLMRHTLPWANPGFGPIFGREVDVHEPQRPWAIQSLDMAAVEHSRSMRYRNQRTNEHSRSIGFIRTRCRRVDLTDVHAFRPVLAAHVLTSTLRYVQCLKSRPRPGPSSSGLLIARV